MNQQAGRKLYSYTRFSTPEQSKGDSLRRQTHQAKAYADRYGFVLDTELTLRDLGKSAYRGRNARDGALGDFLRAIQDGLIAEGACLFVEDEDRLSRQGFWEALPTLQMIINNGVSLGVDREDPLDRAALNSSHGMFALNRLVMKLELAAEESRKKGRRVHEAWQNKRNGAATKPLTVRVPGWLRVEKTADREWSKPELIPDRAAIVQRIFDSYLAGVGKQKIATTLNDEKVPTFGDAKFWQRSYIQKILTNPAVVGVYVPHELIDGKRVPLEPVRDYYPKAVNVETWKRAQALMQSSGGTKARKGSIQNLLAGLAKCPKCGATMTRVSKGNNGKAGKPKLVCAAAKSGARDLDGTQFCSYTSVPLEMVEQAVIRYADNFAEFVPAKDADLQDQIDTLDSLWFDASRELDGLLKALAHNPDSKVINAKVRALETQCDEMRAESEELKARAAQSESKLVARRAERLSKALRAESVDKAAANAALRECFTSAVVDYTRGDLRLSWRHTDQVLTLPYDHGFTDLGSLD